MLNLFEMVGSTIVASDEKLQLLVLWDGEIKLHLYKVRHAVSFNLLPLAMSYLGDTDHHGNVSKANAVACASQWLETLTINDLRDMVREATTPSINVND